MSNICIKCDECTKACPLITITHEDQIWKIYFNEEIDIWNCSSCFRCEESCPVDLSVRNELFKKRRGRKKSEYPPKIIQYFQKILESGNVFTVDELVNERRKTLGLEAIDFDKIKVELKELFADAE